MKKFGKTIAMVLVLVMIAGSFTSCFTFLASAFDAHFLVKTGAVVLDILICLIPIAAIFSNGEAETGIYLAGATYNPFAEYNSILEKLNSLSEPEYNALMEKINSLPERASLANKIYLMPEAEIVASMERVNGLSEADFASAIEEFISLSGAELDSLMEKLHERADAALNIQQVAVGFSY
jgi:hypothetical protein